MRHKLIKLKKINQFLHVWFNSGIKPRQSRKSLTVKKVSETPIPNQTHANIQERFN